MWYREVRSRGLQGVATVEPHYYIIRPKGYLKPAFFVPQSWVTLAPTITHSCEPSRIGYWHVVQRQMLRCELIVDDSPFPHSFLAYGDVRSTPLNV